MRLFKDSLYFLIYFSRVSQGSTFSPSLIKIGGACAVRRVWLAASSDTELRQPPSSPGPATEQCPSLIGTSHLGARLPPLTVDYC